MNTSIPENFLTTTNDSVMACNNATSSNNYALTSLPMDHNEPIRYGCFIMMGIIVPLGLICNTLSLAVFVTSKALIKTSTGHYLVALSIADWLFLAGDLIRWIHTYSTGSHDFYLDVNFMFTNNIACKLTHFIRYGSKLTSAWITIAITVERFISVRWPLHAHSLSTVTRASLVITGTYLTCFGLGAYPLWTVAVAPYNVHENVTACKIINGKHYEIWSWVSLRIGSLLLPGIIMCVLTGCIIFTIAKAKDQRLRRLSKRQECDANNKEQVSHHNMERQLTIILLAVAISFIFLRLPYTITYYVNKYKKLIWKPISNDKSNLIFTVNKVADVIATSNYAINFFLYCVCGSTFRNQLHALLCSCQRRLTKGKHHRATGYSTVSISLSERQSPYKI